MKKEVIIYGGAFNPPTVAHQAIAQAAADKAAHSCAELWLLPSGERNDKSINVPLERRLAYCHALLASLSTTATTQVCDIEIKADETTQTYDTIQKLEKEYPDKRFTWLFGSDSVNTMHEWEGGDWMLRNLSLLVVQRPDYELRVARENIDILDVVQLKTSSTEVRKRQERGLSVSELVPPAVLSLM